jgi:hypothetical protein
MPIPEYRNYLRGILDSRFNESELMILCDELEVKYDDLGGPLAGKSHRVFQLVDKLDKRHALTKLVETGRRLRPDIAWQAPPLVIRKTKTRGRKTTTTATPLPPSSSIPQVDTEWARKMRNQQPALPRFMAQPKPKRRRNSSLSTGSVPSLFGVSGLIVGLIVILLFALASVWLSGV